jgi:hypothetical protein
MLRLLIDQNFNQRILRGLVERIPELDAVTAQGVGLSEAPDSELLSWAAAQGRILLIHDLQTIPLFASARIDAGEPMPGAFIVPQHLAIGRAIEELVTIILCSEQTEWECLIVWLPL